jgi:threonine/homoserine/homoserine lactone efflux protein
MLAFDTLVALAAFVFVSSMTPGPNNLMLMASGTSFGFARTGPHMLGVALGFTFMVLLVALGVGAVFAAVPGAMTVLKIASTVYLLYLAWRIAVSPPPRIDESDAAGRPLTFLQAVAFQWVNPKGWTMALTAAAVYIPADHRVLGALVVTAVVAVMGTPSTVVWAAAGVQLRRLIHRPRAYRAFNVTAALLLVLSLYPVLLPEA